MASRYHWLTPGVDTQFNDALPTAQVPAVSLPAGATVKRFQLRRCYYLASNADHSDSGIFGISMQMQVAFTSGPNSGRIIYQTARDIPFEQTIFVPITGTSRYCFHHAGDNEMGFNERCSYGLASGGAATLAFTYSMVGTRFFTMQNYFGELVLQFAVLYYL